MKGALIFLRYLILKLAPWALVIVGGFAMGADEYGAATAYFVWALALRVLIGDPDDA